MEEEAATAQIDSQLPLLVVRSARLHHHASELHSLVKAHAALLCTDIGEYTSPPPWQGLLSAGASMTPPICLGSLHVIQPTQASQQLCTAFQPLPAPWCFLSDLTNHHAVYHVRWSSPLSLCGKQFITTYIFKPAILSVWFHQHSVQSYPSPACTS